MNLLSPSLLVAFLFVWLTDGPVAGQVPDADVESATAATLRKDKDVVSPPERTRPRGNRQSQSDIIVVGNDVVIREGETFHDVVVVGGSARVDGAITGEFVVIFGNAKLGPNANVRRGLQVIAGDLEADPASYIGRERVVIGRDHKALKKLSWIGWPAQWFNTGLLMARPLPHQYAWSWAIAGVALLLYLTVAVLFPRQVQASVTALEERPGNSLLTGMLAFVLVGPLLLLLAVTVVGIVVIPFALCGMVVAFLFGKIAVYRYAGQQIGTQLGSTSLQKPLLALLVGAALFCLIYTVPVVGFLVWGAVAPLGLGAVLLALFRRRPRPASAHENTLGAGGVIGSASSAVPPAIPSGVSSESPLRVGFWWRFLATALDFALVAIVMAAVFHQPRWFLLVWVSYHLVLWSWKGTTVGGIVFGLRIVGVDGGPINFAVALVRLLGSFFSAAVLGLGFFWAGWSQDKQSWHDKIAGTFVVRSPRATSLL